MIQALFCKRGHPQKTVLEFGEFLIEMKFHINQTFL